MQALRCRKGGERRVLYLISPLTRHGNHKTSLETKIGDSSASTRNKVFSLFDFFIEQVIHVPTGWALGRSKRQEISPVHSNKIPGGRLLLRLLCALHPCLVWSHTGTTLENVVSDCAGKMRDFEPHHYARPPANQWVKLQMKCEIKQTPFSHPSSASSTSAKASPSGRGTGAPGGRHCCCHFHAG